MNSINSHIANTYFLKSVTANILPSQRMKSELNLSYDFIDEFVGFSINKYYTEILELNGSLITPCNIDNIIKTYAPKEVFNTFVIVIIKNLKYDECWYHSQMNNNMSAIFVAKLAVFIVAYISGTCHRIFFSFANDDDMSKFIDTFIQKSSYGKRPNQLINLTRNISLAYKWGNAPLSIDANYEHIFQNFIPSSTNLDITSKNLTENIVHCLVTNDVTSLQVPIFYEYHEVIDNSLILCKMINKCTSLTELKITNRITDVRIQNAFTDGWNNICKELMNNTTITKLTLKYLGAKPNNGDLKEMFMTNTTLKHITLENFFRRTILPNFLLKLPKKVTVIITDSEFNIDNIDQLESLCEHINKNKINLTVRLLLHSSIKIEHLVEKYIHCHYVISILRDSNKLNENFDTSYKIFNLHKNNTKRNKTLLEKLIY